MKLIHQKILSILFCLIFSAALAFILFAPLNIQTDLLSLIPKAQDNSLKEKAFDHVAKQASQNIIILIGGKTKQEVYEVANIFYAKIKNKLSVEEIKYSLNSKENNNLFQLYSPYKFQLLSLEYANLLKSKKGDIIRQKAIQTIYSPVNSSQFIKDDPFLLSYNFLTNSSFLQTSLFPYKDVLISQYAEKYYAFISITLAKESVFSASDLGKNVKLLETIKQRLEAQFPQSEIIISGIPIHSYHASQQAQKEISSIGLISTIGVLLLIYFSFKSFKPLFWSLLAILIAFIVAFSATHIVFGKIHLLTIVFGTSLIGVAVDYSLHFFTQFLDKENKNNGSIILKNIYPGITMGLVTSLLGYLALLFTPFPGLQQISFFSVIGLFTAYGVVILFLPRFYKAKPLNYKPKLFIFSEKFIEFFQQKISYKKAILIFIILGIFSISGFFKLKFNDDIRSLYSSPKALIDNEILTRKILNQEKSIQFFLVTDKSEQGILEKEEKLAEELDKLITTKQLSSYQSLSQMVPSFKKQQENYDLIGQDLLKSYLQIQAKYIGLNNKQIGKIKEDFIKQSKQYLAYKNIANNSNLSILKNFYLGKIDNNYSSIILLNGVLKTNSIKDLQQEDQGIYFMNKLNDISDIFTKYRFMSALLLIAVYSVIFLLLLYRYKFLAAIFIFLPPVLAATTTLSIMAWCGYEINLFNILALFLILGIGVDYAVFYAEAKKHIMTTSFAIILSCITTILSFGLLAMSHFAVIHSFGLTIFLGIGISYLLAPLALLSKAELRKDKKVFD